MQLNIQGVEHDPRQIARIEQIDSYSDFLQGYRELLTKKH